MADFINMDTIYTTIKLNTDKFFDFIVKSIMNQIDNTMTTTDLYIMLSRILGSYNMFIKKVFHYPSKKQRKLIKAPLTKLNVDENPEELFSKYCVVCMNEPEIHIKKEKIDVFDSSFYCFNSLMEIENEYGLIDDILKYLMTKLFSYKYKTIIDNKINEELLKDKQFYVSIQKLAMFAPILLNTIKEFMD